MSRPTDRFLRMTRRFNASPERVYEAWLDPKLARQWLFTSPESDSNETVMDAGIGGKWRITDVREGVSYTADGEYLELDVSSKIVFTFGMTQFSPVYDTITVEFAPDGDGTLMTFTQSGQGITEELASLGEGEISGSEDGWKLMFDALERVTS
jgi:uncharacterized protein YndB with AHSA1/START domain